MTEPSATDIAAAIERDIITGSRSAGERLSSVRSLAAELGVSPTTVAAAYRRLRERGLVIGRGRQGTLVAPRASPAIRGTISAPPNTINALAGNPDPALLPDLSHALIGHLGAPMTGYGESLVDPTLHDIGATDFANDGIDAAHFTVTNGSMDAVARILQAQDFRPGDRIGVEDPGHVPVFQLARTNGLIPVPVAVDQFGMLADSLGAALDSGVRAVVLTPRAQNPTGAALTPRRGAELQAVLDKHPEITLIIDDHAGPISGAPYVAVQPSGPRWAVVRSVGKSLGPDLRVALVAGDQQTIGRVAVGIADGPGWVSHLLQRTAASLLSDPIVRQQLDEAAASYADRRQRLLSRLAERGIEASGPSGFNVYVPVKDEQAAVEAARQGGFAVRAAGAYRFASPPAVRVTVSPLDHAQIDRIADVIANHLKPDRRRIDLAAPAM